MHPDETAAQLPPRNRPATPSARVGSDERRIGRHRAPEPPRRGARAVLASTPARIALAGGVTCCLGLVALAGTDRLDRQPRPVQEVLADRAAEEQRASRARERTALPSDAPTSASPGPSATRSTAPKPTKPARPRPVAGLTPLQMANAQVIVEVGVELGVPRRGLVVAVATAMQESDLHNLASDVLPESYDHPHQGSGSDHDSVGLFQQRPSSGWGTVAQLMRPAYAARAFYSALAEIPGWRQLSITAAAQAVQISAYPGAYARHEDRATTVVDALT
ncbi:hypothetical protein [Micromonospora sp. HUAS LYJ1]|uniref:hypothetical protein n=1 Tax=Micromonospora sp. HUAS LYJ1 TaxID=3061626 RepID=UPI002672B052|nr:hypothetical protein [Micromonospora sp. HUAS LYJ1]WKU05983.1 hypothetical protein Q2K16_02575 [Micromonospora sp. HUAS LYJ1]